MEPWWNNVYISTSDSKHITAASREVSLVLEPDHLVSLARAALLFHTNLCASSIVARRER